MVGALGLTRFALAALDLGGVTAIAYAAKHSDAVSRLLLLEPWASGKRKYETSPTSLALSMNPAASDDWTVWPNVLGGIITGFRDPILAQQLAEAIRESTTPAQLATYLHTTQQIDVVDILASVTAPALVTHATDTVVGSLDLAREVAAGLRDARLLVTDSSLAWPAIRAFLVDDPGAWLDTPRRRSLASLGLSPRQVEVLRLIALGMTNREIADELVLSLRTVERHVADLYTRVGVRNRAEAVAIGVSLDAAAEP